MLQIRKLSTKTWKHIDTNDGAFILTKFYAKLEFNEFLIVESYGSKRRKYLISDIEVYDIGGSAETFANFEDLFLRLEALKYTGFYKDGDIDLDWGSITGNLSDQTDLQNALDSKVDKITTAGVERVYTINADGSQGTKPTSNFKDVLEFADLAAFPATGESGKIYVALDTNFTYRWSGSAYVQIGGGGDEFFTIGQNSFLINSPGVGIWTQQQITSSAPFNLTRTTLQTNHLLIIPDTLTWQGFVPFDCFLSNVFARYDGGGGADEGIVVYKTTGFTTSPTVIYLKNSHTGATALNETFTSGTTINKGDFIHIFVKRNVNVTNISTRMLLTFKRL